MILSKEHGVNATIAVCFFCGKEKNELILTGMAGEKMARKMGNKDGKMPMKACFDKEPCEECQSNMKQGVMFVEVKSNSDPENPCRTGRIWVVTDDFVKRVIDDQMGKALLSKRIGFIPPEVSEMLGFNELETEDGQNIRNTECSK